MSSKQALALCMSVIMLSSCGGGDDAPAPSVGVFLDSAVSGLQYKTATYTGTTSTNGEYNYLPGETISFSIGGVELGSCLAGPLTTPLSLVPNATGASDPVVTNIVRLLLTLDEDANPDNGISISSESITTAANISINFSAENFSADSGVNELLSAMPSTPALVDTTTAQSHFSTTLATKVGWGSISWGEGTWKSTTR